MFGLPGGFLHAFFGHQAPQQPPAARQRAAGDFGVFMDPHEDVFAQQHRMMQQILDSHLGAHNALDAHFGGQMRGYLRGGSSQPMEQGYTQVSFWPAAVLGQLSP